MPKICGEVDLPSIPAAITAPHPLFNPRRINVKSAAERQMIEESQFPARQKVRVIRVRETIRKNFRLVVNLKGTADELVKPSSMRKSTNGRADADQDYTHHPTVE